MLTHCRIQTTTNMKRKLIFVFAGCLLMSSVELSAQCRYYAVTDKNDTTVAVINCDFPVKPSTGNRSFDDNNFIAAFIDWSVSTRNVVVRPNTPGIREIYFVISARDFEAFSEDRRAALRKHPQLFRIAE